MSIRVAIFCDRCGLYVLVPQEFAHLRKGAGGERAMYVSARADKIRDYAYDEGWDEDFTNASAPQDVCPKCCQKEAGVLTLDEDGE